MAVEHDKSRLSQPNNMERVTVRLPPELVAQADAAAEAGMADTRSALIRQSLADTLAQRSWEDFATHIMSTKSERNVFHRREDCRRLKGSEDTIDRTESYLAFHEPTPCEHCCQPPVGGRS